MGKRLNPTIGQVFGCYTVISDQIFMIKNKNNDHHRGHYSVKCKCNRELFIRADILKSGGANRCRYCAKCS